MSLSTGCACLYVLALSPAPLSLVLGPALHPSLPSDRSITLRLMELALASHMDSWRRQSSCLCALLLFIYSNTRPSVGCIAHVLRVD